MKLLRFGEPGNERPGILLPDGTKKDISTLVPEIDRVWMNAGGLKRLAAVDDRELAVLPGIPDEVRLGSCVSRPGKIVCIGLNYSDHAREAGMAIPEEPVIFMKAASSLSGPNDDILIPPGSTKTDWEVELGVIIGKDARHLQSEKDAAAHIAGYCISHDVSEREYQLEHGGQWVKGKSYDSFNPLGPWLVTADEVDDPQDLSMELSVNGEQRQKGSTRTMIFGVHYLVQYLSRFMTLEAGDVITTGTPPGVGMGMSPAVYLKDGDTVDLTITGLGTQSQQCRTDQI